MNYLDFYKECLESGRMPLAGLCNCLPWEDLNLFKPNTGELEDIVAEGNCFVFWASGMPDSHVARDIEEYYGFTPLRQTIVLFLAAIKEQL